MIKALKIVMATYGTVGILFGLSYLLMPGQMSELQGAEELSAFLIATKMALGASLVPVGLFVVISGRDPVRHVLGVRVAILVALLFTTVALYAGTVLYDEFSQALFGVMLHGVFAVALLVFYPWRTVPGGKQTASIEEAGGNMDLQGV
ncbi:MAG TPA: hypothetical protein VF148_04850 [Acidimicrobiia bacterium]